MRTKNLLLVLLICGLHLCAGCEKPPAKWEYRTVRIFAETAEEQLEQLGENGWELAAASGSEMVFKRPEGSGKADPFDYSKWLEHAAGIRATALREEELKGVSIRLAIHKGEPAVVLSDKDFDNFYLPHYLQKLITTNTPDSLWVLAPDFNRTVRTNFTKQTLAQFNTAQESRAKYELHSMIDHAERTNKMSPEEARKARATLETLF